MMSEPNTVDSTTVDELTGKLVLVIEESRPWDDTDFMHRQLAAKARHYVRYVRSQGFTREHDQRPQDTIVRLLSEHAPGEATTRYLERVSYELDKHGITFEYQVGLAGLPVTVPSTVPGKFVPATPHVATPASVDDAAAEREAPLEVEAQPDEPEWIALEGAELASEPAAPGGELEEAELTVFETSSGKRIRLDIVDTVPAPLAGGETARGGLASAIGGALAAAAAGAVLWAVLAVLAGQGASPLAIVVAIMVGMSVRLQGRGQTIYYRLIAIGGTLMGSLIGSLLATATLAALAEERGLFGALTVLASPADALAVMRSYYRPLDLLSLALALYLAYRLSAIKLDRSTTSPIASRQETPN